jgi:hypothetical protein
MTGSILIISSVLIFRHHLHRDLRVSVNSPIPSDDQIIIQNNDDSKISVNPTITFDHQSIIQNNDDLNDSGDSGDTDISDNSDNSDTVSILDGNDSDTTSFIEIKTDTKEVNIIRS